MHYIQYLIQILFATIISASEQVLELTDHDFYSRIAENKHTLVLFYAPWCKRSRRLLPEYSKAAEELLKNGPPIALVQVDCTSESDEVCKDISVDLYPKLQIFKDGQFVDDYHGPHISYGIVKYMKAHVMPPSKELRSLEEVDTFVGSLKEPAVVAFYRSDSPIQKIFKEVSKQLKVKLQFAHYITKNEEKIVLYRPSHLKNKFENSSLIYSGKVNALDLKKFIINHMHGLVGIRNLDNQEDFINPLIIAYFNIDYELNPKEAHYWRNRVLMVAKDFNGVNFAISSYEKFARELESMGITKNPIVVAKKSNNKKYILEEEFSVASLRKFVINFLENNLEPFVKSEPIPVIQSGSITKAVTKNFKKIVNDNNKDTLIKFYAPWCGHCKTLEPIYKEVAHLLRDEDIVFVEMDAVANDVPLPYSVSGYPTIYWARQNRKANPIKYTGGRTIDNIIKFIAKEATEELIGWNRKGELKNIIAEL